MLYLYLNPVYIFCSFTKGKERRKTVTDMESKIPGEREWRSGETLVNEVLQYVGVSRKTPDIGFWNLDTVMV